MNYEYQQTFEAMEKALSDQMNKEIHASHVFILRNLGRR